MTKYFNVKILKILSKNRALLISSQFRNAGSTRNTNKVDQKMSCFLTIA